MLRTLGLALADPLGLRFFTSEKERGFAIITVFMILTALAVMVGGFLVLTGVTMKEKGIHIEDAKSFWLAEAGIQKALWYLKTPVNLAGRGDAWTTSGLSESAGDGTYNIQVSVWDFALSTTGSTVSASSQNGVNIPARAQDGNDSSYWESGSAPTSATPQTLTITFPYAIRLQKVRFFLPNTSNGYRPVDYSWQGSSNGSQFNDLISVSANTQLDRTDEFPITSPLSYLRLRVTRAPGNAGVRIATLQVLGVQILSTGSTGGVNRRLMRTAVVDDTTRTAAEENDWNEVPPA